MPEKPFKRRNLSLGHHTVSLVDAYIDVSVVLGVNSVNALKIHRFMIILITALEPWKFLNDTILVIPKWYNFSDS